MKILTVCTAFPRRRGDVITPWLVRFLKELEKRGHEIYVYTSSYRGLKQRSFNSFKVFRFRYFTSNFETLTHDVAIPERLKESVFYYFLVPFYLFGGIWGVFKYRNFFRRVKIDVIHVHWPIPHIIFGYLFKVFLKKPVVSTFHSAEIIFLKNITKNKLLGKIIFSFFRYFIRKSSFVTVNSSYTKSLIKNFNFPEKFTKVIPFGVSLDFLELNLEEKSHVKEKKILFVGRLVERKGVRYLIEAFKIFCEKYSEYKLCIVGDGPLKEDLLRLTKQLNLEEKVSFLGFVDKSVLLREYLTSSIFVLPAIIDSKGDTEGLGVVLIESMYFGLPVIATSVGGIVDIVIDGYNGLLVKERDVIGLALAMEKLASDSDLREKFIKNAREFVIKNFSWEIIVDKFEKVYALCYS
ncbi:MAG: glycosyltransferase family 4 protein [Candidatus Hydrothermales bacterium]